jgi:PII-like signaling protein
MANEQVPTVDSPAKLLLAIFAATDEWYDEPLRQALVNILEAHGIVGATVLHGITGFGAHRATHRRGLIGPSHDRPAILVVVDNEASCGRCCR